MHSNASFRERSRVELFPTIRITVTIILMLSLNACMNPPVAGADQLLSSEVLSSTRTASATARVYLSPSDPGQFGDVYASFVIRDKKIRKVITFFCGHSDALSTFVSSGRYLETSRKQLFVSGEMGMVFTYIFDVNNEKLNIVYQMTDGRVHVRPAHTRQGGWELVEVWPKNEYEDVYDFGLAYATGLNQAARILVRRGNVFVLKYPGETKILSDRRRVFGDN
jgi:hypothetical protein